MPVYKQAKLVRHRSGVEIPRVALIQDVNGRFITFLYVSRLPTLGYAGKILIRNEQGRPEEVWPTILNARIVVPKRFLHSVKQEENRDSQGNSASGEA